MQVLAPDLTDAVKSFLVVCTPVGLITDDSTGTDYTADTTFDPGLIDDTVIDTGEGKGSACSAWWQGVAAPAGGLRPAMLMHTQAPAAAAWLCWICLPARAFSSRGVFHCPLAWPDRLPDA
jgi:hypothetical protein